MFWDNFSFFGLWKGLSKEIGKNPFMGAAGGSFWAVRKIVFWVLVTIYFMIEKGSENKKVPP